MSFFTKHPHWQDPSSTSRALGLPDVTSSYVVCRNTVMYSNISMVPKEQGLLIVKTFRISKTCLRDASVCRRLFKLWLTLIYLPYKNAKNEIKLINSLSFSIKCFSTPEKGTYLITLLFMFIHYYCFCSLKQWADLRQEAARKIYLHSSVLIHKLFKTTRDTLLKATDTHWL